MPSRFLVAIVQVALAVSVSIWLGLHLTGAVWALVLVALLRGAPALPMSGPLL